MTVPTFVLNPPVEPGAVVTVDERAHHHLIHVLRLTPGASVQGLVAGLGIARCTIASASQSQATVFVDEVLLAEMPTVQISLIASPLKHKGTLDYLAFAGELGLHQVVLTPMRRSVAKVDADQLPRLQRVVNEAARGIGQPVIPKVALASSLDRALELAKADSLFYFWEDGGQPIAELSLQGPSRVAFVVGPEGGFDQGEAVLLDRAGAKALHMKGPLYRASTAITLATTLLMKAANRL